MRRKFKSASRDKRAMRFVLEDARGSRIRVVPFRPAFRVFMCQNPVNPALGPVEWQERVAEAIAENENQQDPARAVLKYIRFAGSPRRRSTAARPVALAA